MSENNSIAGMPAEAPPTPTEGAKPKRRPQVDPVLAAIVTQGVDNVSIENDEVMNNSMVTEYWHNNTRFSGCYPNQDARKAPHLPRWYCKVHVGKGEQRYIYRGTLYQCALAADIWSVAVEPFRKLIVLGHQSAQCGSDPRSFNISETLARTAYRKDERIRAFFWKILEHFEAQGLIVNWSEKRRRMGKAEALVAPYLKKGHLSSRNFAQVILDSMSNLFVLAYDIQHRLEEIEAKIDAVKKTTEPPVEYYDPTKENADGTKVGEGAMPGQGVRTIQTWSDFERIEAEMMKREKEAGHIQPAQKQPVSRAPEAAAGSASGTSPAPENTKEPASTIFG